MKACFLHPFKKIAPKYLNKMYCIGGIPDNAPFSRLLPATPNPILLMIDNIDGYTENFEKLRPVSSLRDDDDDDDDDDDACKQPEPPRQRMKRCGEGIKNVGTLGCVGEEVPILGTREAREEGTRMTSRDVETLTIPTDIHSCLFFLPETDRGHPHHLRD